MDIDYAQLKIDDAAGHPDNGAFSVDAATAADEWNAENRTNEALDITAILKFLILDNTYKVNDGTDTQDRAIWQRMKEVAAMTDTPSAATANPWGSAALGNITEIQQLKTHQLFDLFTLSAQGGLLVDLTDSNFQAYLAGAQSAGCMSEAQETALLELKQRSYAEEKGYPVLTVSHITTARAS